MRVTEDQELELLLRGEALRGDLPQAGTAIARLICAARMRRPVRQGEAEIRMDPAKRANSQAVSQHTSQRPIFSIFADAQPIAVLHARPPAAERSFPCVQLIVDSDVLLQ